MLLQGRRLLQGWRAKCFKFKVVALRSKLLDRRYYCIKLFLLLLLHLGQRQYWKVIICWKRKGLTWCGGSLCLIQESWIISGKVLKEESLIGFSPSLVFFPGCPPTSGVLDINVIILVISWWNKIKEEHKNFNKNTRISKVIIRYKKIFMPFWFSNSV